MANTRLCNTLYLSTGIHQMYLTGFEATTNSELEITYSGPDTFGVKTLVGGQPFFPGCDPRTQLSTAFAHPGFFLCAFSSDPISIYDGDCTPTVGIAHPRYPGPCMKAIGTDSRYYDYFSGGFYVPVLGSANKKWVSACRDTIKFSF